MKNVIQLIFLIPLTVFVASGHAASASNQLDCMIQPAHDVKLGTPLPGVIDKVLVRRGDFVKQGQVIAVLQSDVERAALAVAQARAGQIGEATVANSSQELATRELERANELFGQQFVSRTYLDKHRAEAKAAKGRSTQAIENRSLARQQLRLAQTRLEQRTIRAPFPGVIVERYMEPGEFVDQKPLARLASIDPLRVDVLVPANEFGKIKVGDAGRVFPELKSAGERDAVVQTVDRVIDAASSTFRVRLELSNTDHSLPAGVRCQVDLFLSEPKVRAERKAGENSKTSVTSRLRG